MFGIRYMKAPPTSYVMQFKNGKLKRSGAGLSFFYYAPTSTIAMVPTASSDAPFVFSELTADYQTVTVQGQLTFRVIDPQKVAEQLDYTLNARGVYASDDPARLRDRLVHATQTLTRTIVQKLPLRQALNSAETIVTQVLAGLRDSETVSMLGLEVQGLLVQAVKPTPEMARALEAEAREALLRSADEALYARRNAAVEQERVIRENELNTEIAVETKQRQIRETRIAADIAVEKERAALLEQKTENDRREADTRAYALRASLEPLKEVDWRTLLAAGNADPRVMIGWAFRDLAENAEKIGQLNISPDLLQTLLAPPPALPAPGTPPPVPTTHKRK